MIDVNDYFVHVEPMSSVLFTSLQGVYISDLFHIILTFERDATRHHVTHLELLRFTIVQYLIRLASYRH